MQVRVFLKDFNDETDKMKQTLEIGCIRYVPLETRFQNFRATRFH